MKNNKDIYVFTSESVSEGHSDKICDQISDAILDYCLSKDPNARVGCEVFIVNKNIIIGGEIKPVPKEEEIFKIVKKVLDNIGYIDAYGFSYNLAKIKVLIQKQSLEIEKAVDKKSGIIGAGDQGIMFGFAIDESKNYMPLSIVIAHRLVEYASILRKTNKFKWARPDMKSQVTLIYNNKNKVQGVQTVLMSIQHDKDFDKLKFKNFIKNNIIIKVLKEFNLYDKNQDINYLINPSGHFVVGGPIGDTGLTGRKIIVDTYGGHSRSGGGAFSGKDYTKVDRTASYMCRYVAKNIVAAKIAKKCEIEVSYAISKPKLLSLWIDTKNTGIISDYEIKKMVLILFDFTIQGMIDKFQLKKPIYSKTSVYGHFGKNYLPWEKLDSVDKIINYLNKKKNKTKY